VGPRGEEQPHRLTQSWWVERFEQGVGPVLVFALGPPVRLEPEHRVAQVPDVVGHPVPPPGEHVAGRPDVREGRPQPALPPSTPRPSALPAGGGGEPGPLPPPQDEGASSQFPLSNPRLDQADHRLLHLGRPAGDPDCPHTPSNPVPQTITLCTACTEMP